MTNQIVKNLLYEIRRKAGIAMLEDGRKQAALKEVIELTNALEKVLDGNAPNDPERHGKWIQISTTDNEYVGEECSACHEVQYGFDNYRNYCAFCGARMDAE